MILFVLFMFSVFNQCVGCFVGRSCLVFVILGMNIFFGFVCGYCVFAMLIICLWYLGVCAFDYMRISFAKSLVA